MTVRKSLIESMMKGTIENPQKEKTEKILVVDDESSIRTLVKRFAEDQGYKNVSIFTESPVAYGELKKDHYSIAISDMELPDMTGVEMFNRIKLEKPALITILISGRLMTDGAREEVMAANSGIDICISKPFSLEDFIEALSLAQTSIEQEKK